jgi:hypothetical protein
MASIRNPLAGVLGAGLLVWLCMAGTSGAADGQPLVFDPALARNPPQVQQATIELRKQPDSKGNALLRVRFADKRSHSSIVVQTGPRAALLRDDGVEPDDKAGDGLYASYVQLNAEQFAQEQARRNQLADTVKSLPVFQSRQLIGTEPFRPDLQTTLRLGSQEVIHGFKGVPLTVDPERELFVRDPRVVDDPLRTYDPCTGVGTPMGAWTFGALMTEIANEPVTGIDPATLVEHWIGQWLTDRSINGFNVRARTGAQRLLDRWPRLPTGPDGRRKLDLAQAPFLLLAIVNRVDLRGNSFYGGGDAGEARLAFMAQDCAAGFVHEVNVIFEYAVPRNGCADVRDWARQWHALGRLALGSPAYNAALQAITDQFTRRGAHPRRLPNQSAINQIRTNEIGLHAVPSAEVWELRESKLQSSAKPASGFLEHDNVAQTPDNVFMGGAEGTVGDYINLNAADILANQHVVPLSFMRRPFLGGASLPNNGSFRWGDFATNIRNLEARHRFALATCNGCHAAETGTPFVHIFGREAGRPSHLSNFLTGAGMPLTDTSTGVARHFHELLDRQMKLDLTANMSCLKLDEFAVEELFFEPLKPAFAH